MSGAPLARATSGSGRLRVALAARLLLSPWWGPASEPQTSEAADLDLARGAASQQARDGRMRTRPAHRPRQLRTR